MDSEKATSTLLSDAEQHKVVITHGVKIVKVPWAFAAAANARVISEATGNFIETEGRASGEKEGR